MKNKATIINISLAILLALSVVGSFILFNQFSSSKQTLAGLQTQFDDASVQLKSAQTEFEKLQANIVGIDKSSVQGTTSKQLPTDPNQKLKSGITLWEAKLMIEGQIKTIAGKGYTEAQIKELADMMAKDLGTTMDEINRLPVQDTTVVQQPTKSADNGGKTDNGGQTKPSTTPKPSTGGSQQPSSNTSNKPSTNTKDKDGYTIPLNPNYDYNTWVKAWNSITGQAPPNVRADISDDKWVLMWKEQAAEYILMDDILKGSVPGPPNYYLGMYSALGWVKTIEQLPQKCRDKGCYKYDDGSIYKEGTEERKERSGYYCTDIGLH